METELNIRKYHSGEDESIVELLKTSFNGWPRFDLDRPPLDHWRWKFRSQVEKARTTVAEMDDKIVGCDHMFVTNVKIGEKIHTCMQSVDSAVHPNFRGNRIYSKMRVFDKNYSLKNPPPGCMTYSATNNPFIKKAEGKLGTINFPYQLTQLVRILDIDFHLNYSSLTTRRMCAKYGYCALKILNGLESFPQGVTMRNSKYKIEDVSEFDEEIESFWDGVKEHYSFVTERSREYVDWRYHDPRGGKYTIKQAEEKGEVVGYVVLRINRYYVNYPIGYIVDLCTLPGRLDCADELIKESLKFFDENKINCVYYCTVRGHPYENKMKRFGFVDSRSDIYVTYEMNKDVRTMDELKNAPPNKILFQYNDIDWI
jgi:hypothetical protein